MDKGALSPQEIVKRLSDVASSFTFGEMAEGEWVQAATEYGELMERLLATIETWVNE